MSKNNIILIAILAVLIAVLLIIRHTGDPTERRVRFFDVSLEDITSIEIKTDSDTLVISRYDFDWRIEYPFPFDVDQRRLDNFLTQVLPVETSTTPVALSEESFDNYQVTENRGTLLNFYGRNDRLLDSALIGRSGRFAYARRPDDNRVYQLRDNITFIVSPTLNLWRRNQIVSIPRGEIANIEVTYELNQYQLTPTDTLWLFTDAEQSFSVPANNSALRQILNKIERMDSAGFKDFQYEEYQTVLENPQLVLNVRRADGVETTLLFAFTEEENFVVQKNDMVDHLFISSAETADLFTKSPQHFQ